MINHRTAESLMAAAIDFPLSPDEQTALDAHLAGCDQCRTVGAQLRRHSLVLGEMATEGAPMRIRSAVEAAALQAGATNQRFMLLLAAALLAAAAIGGAIVVGSGQLDLDDLSINPLPSPSNPPSPSGAASAAPLVCVLPPSASAGPAERPPLSLPPLTDAGSRATVIGDVLCVYGSPGTEFEWVTALGVGTEVLLADGPLANHGLDWYEVYFSRLDSDPPQYGDLIFGWVAAGPTGQTPSSLRIEPPRCPDTVTANVVGAMSSLARLQCLGTGPHEVTGVIYSCTDVFVGGEPAWLFTECLNLRNLDGTPSNLWLYFPPDLDTGGLDPRGDQVVRVVGHVDDTAASECRTNTDSPNTALERALAILGCRSAFVLSEIEVTGYLELPLP